MIFILQEKVGFLYKRVYRYLKTCQMFLNDLEDIYSNTANHHLINIKAEDIINSVFKDVGMKNQVSLHRHMFASGITPKALYIFR